MANSANSQTEVWDDTALVDSWNEAFEEYKKYHSLAVKGEKVEIVVEATREENINGDTKPEDTANESSDAIAGAPDVNSGMSAEAHSTISSPALASAPAATATFSMPQALMASGQSDDMKNLMMSWYYAGYYTGLCEGKQQGYALGQKQQQIG